jgi:hypothetical protein
MGKFKLRRKILESSDPGIKIGKKLQACPKVYKMCHKTHPSPAWRG